MKAVYESWLDLLHLSKFPVEEQQYHSGNTICAKTYNLLFCLFLSLWFSPKICILLAWYKVLRAHSYLIPQTI